MIEKILQHYVSLLDDYLVRQRRQPGGLAALGFAGSGTTDKPNRMIVSLLGVEREVPGGISSPVQRTPDGGYARPVPPLLLNLNLLLAAVYDGERYGESLSVLSDTLIFIQSVPKFDLEGSVYAVEVVTLPLQELNDAWSLHGGQYYPSVVCKLRRLVIDAAVTTRPYSGVK